MAKHEGPVVLLKPEDAKRCRGKWVAVINWNDNTVVGSGDAPSIAKKEAEEKGVKNPVVFYVETLTQIY